MTSSSWKLSSIWGSDRLVALARDTRLNSMSALPGFRELYGSPTTAVASGGVFGSICNLTTNQIESG